jgi:2-amino-4-hydroxy-6-hydroxymethyldihydropteridine diphosphokinase
VPCAPSSAGEGRRGPVVLGLGSNRSFGGLGSRDILEAACRALSEVLEDLRRASFYETDPLHVADQGRFLNTAVTGFYRGGPGELLARIQEIEASFGRNRTEERRWGERTLDIDILLFADLVLSGPALEIPHPRLRERRFALVPLLELLPGAQEPRSGVFYRTLCGALPSQGFFSRV